MVPEWVFYRCERCSHELVASRRSSELPRGGQQAEGASGQGDAFLFGKDSRSPHFRAPNAYSYPHIIDPIHSVAVMEGRDDDGIVMKGSWMSPESSNSPPFRQLSSFHHHTMPR